MNKGFTLAELLGVVAIIGVIAIIVTVSVDQNIKNSRYQTCMLQEENIKENAKIWAQDNPIRLNEVVEGKELEISLNDLENDGYIDKLTSPMTNKEYSESTKIKITALNKNYKYQIIYGLEKEICR